EFLRICENLCSQMKLSLKIVRYWSQGDSVAFANQDGTSTSIGKDSSVLGYILWAESPDDLYKSVLSYIDISRKPVALLQEGSQIHMTELARTRMLKVFSIATGSSAARKVASFLLQLGHKSVAYFSAFHKSDWSKARLYGIQEIYNRTGADTKVSQYTLDSYGYFNEFFDALKPPERYLQKFVPDLMLANQMPHKVLEAFNRLRPDLANVLVSEAVRMFMLPLFNKAIKNEECTAWICSNDYIGLMAMDYLKEYSPRKITLTGFDDTFEAFRRGLTSYNFNIQALVQLMLGYIVNPVSGYSKSNNVFENEGMIVERATTFKVS
ncbi:MAG: substrate-binding domain-containing protein, partial [Fibrobacter sp.]|nr:substrate-binding domain-containing protein [Fibrobacter sp.]